MCGDINPDGVWLLGAEPHQCPRVDPDLQEVSGSGQVGWTDALASTLPDIDLVVGGTKVLGT